MKCKICGKEFQKSPYRTEICSTECFKVDFWNKTLDNSAVIIDGNCYHIGPENQYSQDKSTHEFCGHCGEEFNIQFNDGRIILTHNLWHNGEIPKERNIKDNAKFI